LYPLTPPLNNYWQVIG